jgi:hypothetical protein
MKSLLGLKVNSRYLGFFGRSDVLRTLYGYCRFLMARCCSSQTLSYTFFNSPFDEFFVLLRQHCVLDLVNAVSGPGGRSYDSSLRDSSIYLRSRMNAFLRPSHIIVLLICNGEL